MKRFMKLVAFSLVAVGALSLVGVRNARADGFSFSFSSGPTYSNYGSYSSYGPHSGAGMFGYGPGGYSSGAFGYGYGPNVVVQRYPSSRRLHCFGPGSGHHSNNGHYHSSRYRGHGDRAW